MPATQLNVRIDDEVKRRGDEVIARENLTPSKVVREVWGVLAEGGARSDALLQVLEGGKRPADEHASRLRAAREGWSLYGRALSVAGVPARAGVLATPDVSDDELLEEALWERMSERGLA